MSNPLSPMSPSTPLTRRNFLKQSGAGLAGGALLTALPIERMAHGAGGGELKIAMVGCGGRATGAANQALHNSGYPNVKLVAVAELFKEKADLAIQALSTQNPGKVDVPQDRIFLGFDAYKKAIAACDVVILATPCCFRPMMFEEAVKQGKNIFMEKPVAVDAAGVRKVLEVAQEAKKKNLKVGVGLQRRHKPGYIETVKRVQDGAIGEIFYARCFWDMGVARAMIPRRPEWNELEYQLHNQFYFAWQCADICVDMGLHNIDVINWIKGIYPVTAKAVCGAEVRKGPGAGQIMDHFAIEYEYADGVRLFAQNRQIPGCWNNVTENAHGTKGNVEMVNDRTIFNITDRKGNVVWSYPKETPIIDPYQREHDDLFGAIAFNNEYNEAERGAMSTMTAIMGRMAGYSGQLMTWDEALKSDVRMSDLPTSLQDEPPVKPDASGAYPLPVPGKYKAI